MTAETFADTNVLIYAISGLPAEHDKATAARRIVRQSGVAISLQVLGEFYTASVSRRRQSPLTHEEAAAWLEVWKRLIVGTATLETVEDAVALCGRHGISYYDALILATARAIGCSIVYSEDLNPGQVYDGVRVVNPF